MAIYNFKLQACNELLHETSKVTIHVHKMRVLIAEVFIRPIKIHYLLVTDLHEEWSNDLKNQQLVNLKEYQSKTWTKYNFQKSSRPLFVF